MWKTLLFVAGLMPWTASAEALNYDYVYLSTNGTESDGHGTAGAFKSFGGHTHVFASFDDTAFYAGSHENWDYDLRTVRMGAGGHYLVGSRTMVAPSVSVFRSQGEVLAPSWVAPRELNGTGYIAQVDIRHALTERIELTAAARRTLFSGERWNETVGGVMFHATPAWAVGVLYRSSEAQSGTEFTLRYYY